MKLNRFYKLKNNLETFSFEKNFSSLSNTLYYFSFLGNIFLVLFSYFFIKDVTNTIPTLFKGQDTFFSIFIILFMVGYELFKRFAFQQLTSTILKIRKVTLNITVGTVVCIGLVAGSFYLSLNGAHRLVDSRPSIEAKLDTVQNQARDSILGVFKQRIALKEQQIQAIHTNDEDGVLNNRQQSTIRNLEKDITQLELDRDTRIKEYETRSQSKLGKEETKVKQNSLAFVVMVFFLEFIILIGVAFSAYYDWTSYTEMKKVLVAPKFKRLELNLQLLKLYYQNGRKNEQDQALSRNKLLALVKASQLPATGLDVNGFLELCSELEITSTVRRKKVFNMSYEKAVSILEKQEIF